MEMTPNKLILKCAVSVFVFQQTGNHDRLRITSVKGAHFASAFNTLLLLLPGTPTSYQGEEIGMLNIELTFEQTKDPNGIRHGKVSIVVFSPQPLTVVRVLFSPMVSGWAGRWREEVCRVVSQKL